MLIHRTVTVADLQPGDLLVGSNRTVVWAGERSFTSRGHRTVVVQNVRGERHTYEWNRCTTVTIARETDDTYTMR